MSEPSGLVGKLIFCCLFIPLILFILQSWNDLTCIYPLDYGEGSILNSAIKLANGKSIYESDLTSPPWTITNYPPVIYIIEALFIKLFGISFVYGRIISTCSTLISSIFIGLISFHFFRDKVSAIISGIGFLSIPFVLSAGTLGRVDSLATCFTISGIYAALSSDNKKSNLILSGILLYLAIFTKQTALCFGPITVFCLLFYENRKKAFVFVGCLLTGTIISGCLLDVVTRGGFFLHTILANVNELDTSRIYISCMYLIMTLPFFILCSGHSLFNETNNRFKYFFQIFSLFSLSSFFLIAKRGSDFYYFFDFASSLSIGLGAFYNYAKNYSSLLKKLVVLMLLVQLFISTFITTHSFSSIEWRRSPKYLEQLAEIIKGEINIIIMDDLNGFQLLENREIFYQPFEMIRLQKSGLWNDQLINTFMKSGQVSLIIMRIDREDLIQDRWSSEQLQIVDAYFKEEQKIGPFSVRRFLY